MDPRFLDLAEVLGIHVDQIERYGRAAGVRDLPLLLSALVESVIASALSKSEVALWLRDHVVP